MKMIKWADYLISAVRYGTALNGKTIMYCKVHPDKIDSVGAGSTWTKDEILQAYRTGKTFVTIYRDGRGKWKKGRGVTIDDNSKSMIITDSENLYEDNLADLSEL